MFESPAVPRGTTWLYLALVCLPALALAQPPAARTLADLKNLPGPIVAEATPGTGVAAGAQAVSGYRVRHLSLPTPWLVTLDGRPTRVRQAWHVQLSFARPLSVRSQAFSLVVDGRWCGFLAEAPDLRSADTVCFDPALMRSGAILGATYRAVTLNPADDAVEVAPSASFDGEGGEPVLEAASALQLGENR